MTPYRQRTQPLMRRMHWYRANKYVLRTRLKQSLLIVGSRMKEFQTIGPAAEKVRQPYVLSRDMRADVGRRPTMPANYAGPCITGLTTLASCSHRRVIRSLLRSIDSVSELNV